MFVASDAKLKVVTCDTLVLLLKAIKNGRNGTFQLSLT